MPVRNGGLRCANPPGATGFRKYRFDCQTARGCRSAFSRRDAPEFCVDCHPLNEQEGAGKAGWALHPRSRVQKGTKKRTRAYRFSGGNPAFPARWFTAYSALSPATGLSCHRHPREVLLPANLTPASGRQDHTASPSARVTLFSRNFRVHRIPPRVRDDRDPPLSSGETGEAIEMICPTGEAEYFCKGGWTAKSLICPSGKSVQPCQRSQIVGRNSVAYCTDRFTELAVE